MYTQQHRSKSISMEKSAENGRSSKQNWRAEFYLQQPPVSKASFISFSSSLERSSYSCYLVILSFVILCVRCLSSFFSRFPWRPIENSPSIHLPPPSHSHPMQSRLFLIFLSSFDLWSFRYECFLPFSSFFVQEKSEEGRSMDGLCSIYRYFHASDLWSFPRMIFDL